MLQKFPILLSSSLLLLTPLVLSQSNDCDTVLKLWKDMGGKTTQTDGCRIDGVVQSRNKDSVIKVLWQGKGLIGSIPKEIGNLGNLTELWLNLNKLSGSIPTEIGNLKNLRQLRLSFNKLSGSIPTEIGNLENIENILLSDNEISGSIPKEIGNIKALRNIGFAKNSLSGPIPKEIGKLAGLTTGLDLSYNQLTGPIPSEIGNLVKLQDLKLCGNSLSGPIPKEIGKMEKLEEIMLHYNQLSGSIPVEIGTLKILKKLRIAYNKLNGSIPKDLGKLANLENLELHFNQLSGLIPTEIGNLPNLKLIWLNNNQLTGVPNSISALKDKAQLVLLPNPMSTIPYDVFARNPAVSLSTTNWTNLLDTPVLMKRQMSSTMSGEDLYQLCPLNDVRNSEVVAGCVSGIYNKFCKNLSNLGPCQSAYDTIVSQSYFAPLGVCAAWKSGPKSSKCTSAISTFRVRLDFMTLTASHARDFVSSIFGSKTYAPCSSGSCQWGGGLL